jgi:cation diffusion facilitator CzcD-associated flavoprotein CzcO
MSTLKTFNELTGEWEAYVETVEVAQEIAITDSSKGLVLYSATKQWRLTVNDSGTLVITEITPL